MRCVRLVYWYFECRAGAGRGLFDGIATSVAMVPRGVAMSIDKSLKKAAGMGRARNVLTRPERMAVLQEDEKWTPANGVYNLPKTKYRRLAPGQSGPKRPEADKA